ncbi:hypothetical protein K501DRAFT_311329 [Backusella circina FSU 941]|nr:hypothetical protein K501DRAFT_311329 [Backusella circina FSU 941]
MGVVIDNQAYPLNPSSNCPLFYTGSAPQATGGYQYAKLDSKNTITEKEPFIRPMVSTKSLNDFYNRSNTVTILPKLTQVLSDLDILAINDTKPFKSGDIPTLCFTIDEANLNKVHNAEKSKTVSSDLTYISSNEVKEFKDVDFELSGSSPLTRYAPKASYKIELPKNNTFNDYRKFKLRSLYSDPSYLREYVSAEILNSTGLPAPDFTFSRVFINGNSYGLFGFMVDYRKPWLLKNFAYDSDDYTNGPLYSGDNNATLAYIGTNQSAYNTSTNGDKIFPNNYYSLKEEQASKQSAPSYRRLIGLTKFLASPAEEISLTNNTIAAWERRIYPESFLRAAALEILLGNTNGYVTAGENYMLYGASLESYMTFIASSMESTFGNTVEDMTKMLTGNYTDYPGVSNDFRPLLQEMLKVPEYNSRFQELLSELSNKVVNPSVLSTHIDVVANMIRDDVTWDQAIARNYVDIGNKTYNAQLAFNTSNPTDAMNDYINRSVNGVDFDKAVNGSTGHSSLSGVKEWVTNQHNAISGNKTS